MPTSVAVTITRSSAMARRVDQRSAARGVMLLRASAAAAAPCRGDEFYVDPILPPFFKIIVESILVGTYVCRVAVRFSAMQVNADTVRCHHLIPPALRRRHPSYQPLLTARSL